MARPRPAPDPERWTTPCCRCGQHYKIAAHWSDGPICGYCYLASKRTRGTCACGHQGILPGRLNGEPACRTCTGVRLNIDCRGCGREDEIYASNQCWNCVLASTVDQLLADPQTGVIQPQLVPLAEALKSMKRANSGLTWIRQEHVSAFLRQLASAPVTSHEAIDALPRSRTREFVRALLVEHGALPHHDTYLARYIEWTQDALDRPMSPANREVIDRYIRWQHLRRMNQMTSVSKGTFLRSKQSVTVAIDLLNWIAERDVALSELQQCHLDEWTSTGTSTRLIADRFLAWAAKSHLVEPGLKIRAHRRGTSPRMPANDQALAIQKVVDAGDVIVRDRAAAILVLVFGQQVERVVTLTWDNVTITDETATIELGTIRLEMPPPLDQPWRELAAALGNVLTAAHPHSNWVFLGTVPGRHLDAGYLSNRLGRIFSARAARLGTLHELTKSTPIAVIAEALGYSPATLERHAIGSANAYGRYVAAIQQQQ